MFPFNEPEAPAEGDNQALAVNTTDGSIVYDVAFALVWADDGEVLNTNEAYAFASCTGCAAVAIGFQVILVLGQADVVVPQNLAAAVNYNCLECATYALAQQLVLTLDGPLSDAGMAAIEAVWAQIQQFGSTIANVPVEPDPGDPRRVRAADRRHRAGGGGRRAPDRRRPDDVRTGRLPVERGVGRHRGVAVDQQLTRRDTSTSEPTSERRTELGAEQRAHRVVQPDRDLAPSESAIAEPSAG